MNIPRIMIIAGSIVCAFGILFIAQSQSVVGPESSYMYRNPDWSLNGNIIAAAGAATIAAGTAAGLKRRNR